MLIDPVASPPGAENLGSMAGARKHSQVLTDIHAAIRALNTAVTAADVVITGLINALTVAVGDRLTIGNNLIDLNDKSVGRFNLGFDLADPSAIGKAIVVAADVSAIQVMLGLEIGVNIYNISNVNSLLALKANITSPNFLTSAILGGGDGTASPLAFTARGPVAVGPNITAPNLTITGPLATGVGGGGSIIFKTGLSAASGSTLNTEATVFTLGLDRLTQFEGTVALRNSKFIGSYKADGTTFVNLIGLDVNNDFNITPGGGGIYFNGMSTVSIQNVAAPSLALTSTTGGSNWTFVCESGGNWNLRSSGAARKIIVTQQGIFSLTVADTATSAVTTIVTWQHNTSGTPAAGYGSAVAYQLQSSTTINTLVGRDTVEWFDVTHASRKARRKWTVYDTAEREAMRADSDGTYGVVGFGGAVVIATTLVSITSPAATYVGLAVKMAASPTADPLQVLDSTSAVKASINKDGILRQAGSTRLVSDVTNATTTMANLSDLTVTLIAGRKYRFRLQLFLNDSVAIDGAKVDFDGGSATMTSFRAHGTVFDTALLLSSQVNAIATDFVVPTITGDAMVEIYGAFVVNAAGTFIPRVAQNSHTTGTITAYLNSHLVVEECAV